MKNVASWNNLALGINLMMLIRTIFMINIFFSPLFFSFRLQIFIGNLHEGLNPGLGYWIWFVLSPISLLKCSHWRLLKMICYLVRDILISSFFPAWFHQFPNISVWLVQRWLFFDPNLKFFVKLFMKLRNRIINWELVNPYTEI